MENPGLIYVLGLGASLREFTDFGSPTIGVNDINSKIYIPTDYLVIQDQPTNFDFDRYTNIISKPPKLTVFSPHEQYKDAFPGRFQKVFPIPYALSLLTEPVDKFNRWEVPTSLDSTFMACTIAARLGYKEIILFGADFTNHPDLTPKLFNILNQYDLLRIKLESIGIKLFVGSKKSKLTEVLPLKK